MLMRSLVLGVIAVGCAQGGTGGSGTGGDDDPMPPMIDAPATVDSNPSTLPDAPVPDAALPPADAAVTVDAFVPQDAPPSVFCTENFQCTASGECCITLGGPMGFCGPGTIIFDECFPQ